MLAECSGMLLLTLTVTLGVWLGTALDRHAHLVARWMEQLNFNLRKGNVMKH